MSLSLCFLYLSLFPCPWQMEKGTWAGAMSKDTWERAHEKGYMDKGISNKLTVKCTQMCTFWAPFSVNFILYNLSPQIHVKYSMIFHWPSNMMAKCHFFISSGGSSSYFAIPQPPLIFFSKKLGFLQELLCHCPHKHSPPNFY